MSVLGKSTDQEYLVKNTNVKIHDLKNLMSVYLS